MPALHSNDEPNFSTTKELSSHATTSNNDAIADAFLYYSNNDVRMKRLKFMEDDTRDSNDNKQGPQHQVRKTRLSWEVHPSVFFDDMDVDDLDLDGEGDLFDDFDLDILTELSTVDSSAAEGAADLLRELIGLSRQ